MIAYRACVYSTELWESTLYRSRIVRRSSATFLNQQEMLQGANLQPNWTEQYQAYKPDVEWQNYVPFTVLVLFFRENKFLIARSEPRPPTNGTAATKPGTAIQSTTPERTKPNAISAK